MLHQLLIVLSAVLFGICVYVFTKKVEQHITNKRLYILLCWLIGTFNGICMNYWLISIGI